ncbi:MAG TPA: nuclear transport factor 2 family protein [Solimonas sp.]|nr:nuclear transport factor 2 family protein [Solimonas sp.]
MHPHAALIDKFYRAFQQRDAATMASCYHAEAHFSDPAFPDLRGTRATSMWTMLCARGKDLRLEYRDVRADEHGGAAHWEAWYTFSRTGRQVHNVIDATFEFREGLIIRHIDSFDFHRWAGQALGLPGKLLGGTAFMQKKVQKLAAAGLDDFIARGA